MSLDAINDEIKNVVVAFEMKIISKEEAAERLNRIRQDNLFKLDRMEKVRLDTMMQKARVQVAVG